jgi:hypothetical protein
MLRGTVAKKVKKMSAFEPLLDSMVHSLVTALRDAITCSAEFPRDPQKFQEFFDRRRELSGLVVVAGIERDGKHFCCFTRSGDDAAHGRRR